MIELQLLGTVAVSGAAPSVEATVPRRGALALLAYVAAVEPQPVPREKVLAMLWPESDTERARNSLRQTIFSLRKDLGEDLFLPESRSGLQLDASHIRVDLGRVREAIANGAPAEAVEICRGPFLDGFHVPGVPAFDQWMGQERDRIARQQIGALEALAQCAERAGRLEEAVSWRWRRADADPLDGRAALALLKALAAAGDRAGALRYASQHERLIRDELEIEPDPVITAFVASLRSSPPPGVRIVARTADAPVQAVETRRAPAVTVAAELSVAPARQWYRRPLWLGAAAILVVALAAGGWWAADARTATPPVLVLASGAHTLNGRDLGNRLIACQGPACPSGEMPRDAYVIPTHTAWATPAAGSEYISPVADGMTIGPPGYACCTKATFENSFRLPSDAVSATLVIQAFADNQAIVAINGVEFGRQADSLSATNYADQGGRFVVTFAPDPSGTNRLQVTLWDGGGALGIAYMATVTYETGRRR